MTEAADRLRTLAFHEGEKKVARTYRFQRAMAAALREGARLCNECVVDTDFAEFKDGLYHAADKLRALADELEGRG